jgi:hypothetical protein
MICITCQATVELWRCSWLRCRCTRVSLYSGRPLPDTWKKVTATSQPGIRKKEQQKEPQA